MASDAPSVRAEVAAIAGRPDITIREARSGPAVMAVVAESLPDLVVVDLQMGNMGGMAVCLELRLEASYGKLEHVPVLMLLDRRPDVFLARRSGAEGWVVKPLDPDPAAAGGHLPARRGHLLRRVLPTSLRRVPARTCRRLTARPNRQRHHRVRVPTPQTRHTPRRARRAGPTGRHGGGRADGGGLNGRHAEGGADAQEQFIIDALHDLHDTVVREVMTPRVDVVALSIPLTVDAVTQAVRESGHSCFPVYGDNLDDLIGVLFVNDLFRAGWKVSGSDDGGTATRALSGADPGRTGRRDRPAIAGPDRHLPPAAPAVPGARVAAWSSTCWPRCGTSGGPSPWWSTSTAGSRGS